MLYLYCPPLLNLLINFVLLLLRSSTTSGEKRESVSASSGATSFMFSSRNPSRHPISCAEQQKKKKNILHGEYIKKRGGDSNNNNNNQCLITGPFNRYVYIPSAAQRRIEPTCNTQVIARHSQRPGRRSPSLPRIEKMNQQKIFS